MNDDEIPLLARAHNFFAGPRPSVAIDSRNAHYDQLLDRTTELNTGAGHARYLGDLTKHRQTLLSSAQTDTTLAAILADAHRSHSDAHQQTKIVLDAARADPAPAADTPIGQREQLRRRIARLRAQQGHVLTAREHALRHRAALLGLRYHSRHHITVDAARLPPPTSRAGTAVRAALSRLGCPYVWGATGPNHFDCSGLTQWAWGKAGIHLQRSTYEQIHDGVPVPRSQVQPGDLVFPEPGHVQMAISHDAVVEAPYTGADVRTSPLGSHVQIRRPLQ
jgi:peptidoglycan DL-endopeptidase CwlO